MNVNNMNLIIHISYSLLFYSLINHRFELLNSSLTLDYVAIV